jgi:hypothetical protein
MRRLLMVLMSISLWASFAVVSRASQTAPPAACPATTQVESTAIARAWHDDVVNRRNLTMLSDILGPEVVHHAAGGYPKIPIAQLLREFAGRASLRGGNRAKAYALPTGLPHWWCPWDK